jgi:ketosteroid isomerase-like protein
MSHVAKTLTPGDGQDALAHFKRAWQSRDVDAVLELFAEDGEYRTDPFVASLSGATAIREHWNRIAAEQTHIDFDAERVWVSGRTVLASWHAAYTRRATAARFRVRGFSTIEIDDSGLISRMRDWSVTHEIGIDSKFKPEGEPETGEIQDG